MHRAAELTDQAGGRVPALPPQPAARHQAQLTEAALDAIEVGVVVIDDQRRLVHANAASRVILGVDLASGIAPKEWWRPLLARRSSDGASLELDADAWVLQTGEGIRDVGLEIARPDGAAISLAVDHLPLRTGPGPVTGVVLTFRDVTDLTVQELAHRELVAARDFFQATLDSFPAQVAVLDQKGEVLTTNRAWKQFALANGGVASPTTNYFAACDAAGDDEFALRAAVGLRAVAAGEREQFTLEYPCSSSEEERWFLLRGSRYEGPGSARMVVAHYDITARRVAQRQVLEQARLLDEVDVAVIATDLSLHVTEWNRKAEELYGWSRREAVGQHVDKLLGRTQEHSQMRQQALAAKGHWEDVCTVKAKDGTTFPSETRVRTMTDASGSPFGVVGVSSDITLRIASERALIEARDYLRAVADSMGQGLLTLDVDGRVSYVNAAAEASLGWTRDQLLGRSMADITAVTSRVDGSVEGPTDPLEPARLDATEVRAAEAVFLRSDGTEIPVAHTAAPFETATGVQGHVVLFEDISERKAYEAALLQDVEKLSWIDRVQQALAEDRFVLHAQPIIDLRTGDVVQRELLLRMREPDGSIVGPRRFLPIAEKYGLIGEIDWWVIEQAAAAAATGLPVEINVSARSVGDLAIIEHIEQCLRDSGADPSLIVFEITETALVEDEAAALAFAEHIHELGSKLALDDFGTGYGTFTYLKNLPVDFLKIDIEFVRDLASNRASHHVVQAVVALAQAFGLQTIAEGVEDGETLELLRTLGVDFAQGYFIARPGPMEAGDVGIGGTIT